MSSHESAAQPALAAGRYAPSPSGDLHVGNLRTAVLAWLFARTSGRRFLLRMENLDRTAVGSDQRQIDDLHALGIDWEPPVVYQTDRLDRYRAVIDDLTMRGRTFECFCTRREILEAPSAPHAPQGAYPGTCRDLTPEQRAEKIAAGEADAALWLASLPAPRPDWLGRLPTVAIVGEGSPEAAGETADLCTASITIDGTDYEIVEHGTASYRSEGTTGLNEKGGLDYVDYESPDGTLLAFERVACLRGDRLLFAAGPRLMEIEVAAYGERRGPAEEARGLYRDVAPPPG